jgi:hypothetical protein
MAGFARFVRGIPVMRKGGILCLPIPDHSDVRLTVHLLTVVFAYLPETEALNPFGMEQGKIVTHYKPRTVVQSICGCHMCV